MRVIFLVVGLSACTPAVETDTAIRVNSPLSWMEGCWITQDGTTTERWTGVLDTHLFGTNVTIKDDQVVFFEQLRIERSNTGFKYQAYPRGIGPAGFAMESSGRQTISFINPEHDYPQRIAYTLTRNVLTASVSLMDGSKSNVWEYHACER